ncbi:MAG: translation factor GTPase family protein [Chlamydiota bacterium]
MNIGILAHVDAGKTSLTERLLFFAGVIDRMGSVDKGSTQTDSMELERERGITIQSAVVSFTLQGRKIHLIDTPGHSDFISEVERALRVLDGAILVISAVEGVQPQTRVLMHTLSRLKIPTLLFINKIDRKGAREQSLLEEIAQKLTPHAIPLNRVSALGSKEAATHPFSDLQQLIDALAENNDSFLEAYVKNPSEIDSETCLAELASQTQNGSVHPVYFGSAITGRGIEELTAGICSFLSPPQTSAEGPPQGSIFKIEREDSGEKVAYVRLDAGTLSTRDEISLSRRALTGEMLTHRAKVTAIKLFENGKVLSGTQASAGNIAKVWGLKEARVGDKIGVAETLSSDAFFSPPTLETAVRAKNPLDNPALFAALQKMAEEDPLIHTRMDGTRQEISIRLYGEVQKEVVKARLLTDYGIEVLFKETKTVLVERPTATGEALYQIDMHGSNAFYVTVGLRVEPGPPNSGVQYLLAVERGSLPKTYHSVLKESVYARLKEGLHGWEVTDCIVTLTHTGICPLSMATEFRTLGPLILMQALERAGTHLCEPSSRFDLKAPAASASILFAKLCEASATVRSATVAGGFVHIEGILPTRSLHPFEIQLPTLTQGSGILHSEFAGYTAIG